MNEFKHYIIIDNLSSVYKYNIDSATFSSNVSKATLRTYEESEKMIISIYFHSISMPRRCKIKNIRKIKLEMLNNIL